MNANAPSLDAAAHFTDRLNAANEASRRASDDLTAARAVVAAIQAIADIDFTPAVAAQIACVLSNQICASSWSHWPEAIDASEHLDSAHDRLAD